MWFLALSEKDLPLKKRRLHIIKEEEKKNASHEEISYPATPMLSIADLEFFPVELFQPLRRIKTPAERKQIPSVPYLTSEYNIFPKNYSEEYLFSWPFHSCCPNNTFYQLQTPVHVKIAQEPRPTRGREDYHVFLHVEVISYCGSDQDEELQERLKKIKSHSLHAVFLPCFFINFHFICKILVFSVTTS